LNHSENAGRPI